MRADVALFELDKSSLGVAGANERVTGSAEGREEICIQQNRF
jgi:hypothetical protein